MTTFLSRRTLLGLLAGLLTLTLAGVAQGAITVEKIPYRGWHEAYKISNGTVDLIVTAEVGPRIIFYGFSGAENEFHEFPDQVGKTGGSDWHSYGGHRLWVAPETDRTYFPDNVPLHMVREGNIIKFIAPVQEAPLPTHLQFEIDIQLAATGTHVHLEHKITNHGATATEMAPWSISVMADNGRAILPLPPKAPWGKGHLLPAGALALWSYTDFSDPRWVLGQKYIELKQDPHPTGTYTSQKIGVRDVEGWGAYYRAGHLFVKRSGFSDTGRYPDFGCNFETYTEPAFLELETLGSMRHLQPHTTAVHVEDWWLYKDVPAGEGDSWVTQAVLPLVKKSR